MSDERRKYTRYNVSWRGRALLVDRTLHNAKVIDVSVGGIGIELDRLLKVGTLVSVEFFAEARGMSRKIRAKTRVSFNTVLSDNRGAKLGLQFLEISSTDMHDLRNVIQRMSQK